MQEEQATTAEVSVEQLGLPESTTPVETEASRLRAVVEAALYITDEPLVPKQIAEALGQPVEHIETLLASLVEEYEQPQRGLSVRELAGGYKMSTKAEHHDDLRSFVKKLKPPLKLSLAALETLAVIAYKQPITAPEILEIRGVQGAGVLKTLLDRKFITVSGRKQVVGKPALYKTTKEFLIQFGLKDLAELPTLKEFEELSRLALGDEEPEEAMAVQDPPPAESPIEDPPPAETPADDPPSPEAPVEEPPSEEPPAEVPPEEPKDA